MKRNDILLLTGTAAYSALFYQQSAGINFFIFTMLMIIAMKLFNPITSNTKTWFWFALLAGFSGFFVMLYGSALAVFVNIVSLLMLSSVSLNAYSSLFFNFGFAVMSVLGSCAFFALNRYKKMTNSEKQSREKRLTGILVFIMIFIILLVFFVIFREANPLFKKYTDFINLDFISAQWIVFTLIGFFIVYGLLNNQRLQVFDDFDKNQPLQLDSEKKYPKAFWNEKNAALALFSVLNIMVLVINLLDINFLYLGMGLPEGITHSQFIHEGVGNLMLSIFLAVGIILYFFRGHLNFGKENQFLRVLLYIWIAQNMMMICSTLLRNFHYIEEYNLTYKRIGVYYYLFVVLAGLFTVFLKLYQQRSNWYLFRINSIILYVILVLSAGVDWDLLISKYNIRHESSMAKLDKSYLINLSSGNIPDLIEIRYQQPALFNTDSVHLGEDPYYYSVYGKGSTNTQALDIKLYLFLRDYYNKDLREWTLRDYKTYHEIIALNEQGKIKSLNYHEFHSDLKYLSIITHLKALDLSGQEIIDLPYLASFRQLEKLDLHDTRHHENILPALPELKYLNYAHTVIAHPDLFSQLPLVEEMDISATGISDFTSVKRLKKLKKLTADGNGIKDISALNVLPLLEWLSLNNNASVIEKTAQLKNLKTLHLNDCESAEKSLKAFASSKNLEKLTLNNSIIKNLMPLMEIDYSNHPPRIAPLFPNLKHLSLSSNSIDSIYFIEKFTQLQTLNLSYNRIESIDELAGMTQLQQLNLAGNHLKTIAAIKNLTALTWLNLSNCKGICDFENLKELNHLEFLDLSSSSFNDFKFLNCTKTLKELNIKYTPLTSLSGIEKFAQLEKLSLTKLTEVDIAHLKKLKKLTHLYLHQVSFALVEKIKNELKKVKVIES